MCSSRAKGGAIFCSTVTWLRCERSRKLSRRRQRGLKCRRQSGEGGGNSQGGQSNSLTPYTHSSLYLPLSACCVRQRILIFLDYTLNSLTISQGGGSTASSQTIGWTTEREKHELPIALVTDCGASACCELCSPCAT